MARTSRALRRELGLRQRDLVHRGIPVRRTHLVESGEAGSMTLDDVRSHFAALGAVARVTVSWNGGALDRLLDARHAAVVESLVRVLDAMVGTCALR